MLHAEGAAWTKKEGKTNLEDSTKKDESLTKEKIQDLTSKAPSKKVGNPRKGIVLCSNEGYEKETN